MSYTFTQIIYSFKPKINIIEVLNKLRHWVCHNMWENTNYIKPSLLSVICKNADIKRNIKYLSPGVKCIGKNIASLPAIH